MVLGQAYDGRRIEHWDAFARRNCTAQQARNRLERPPRQAQFARAMDLRMAGEHLFNQGRARTGQAKDENGPPARRASGREPGKQVTIKPAQESVDEAL